MTSGDTCNLMIGCDEQWQYSVVVTILCYILHFCSVIIFVCVSFVHCASAEKLWNVKMARSCTFWSAASVSELVCNSSLNFNQIVFLRSSCNSGISRVLKFLSARYVYVHWTTVRIYGNRHILLLPVMLMHFLFLHCWHILFLFHTNSSYEKDCTRNASHSACTHKGVTYSEMTNWGVTSTQISGSIRKLTAEPNLMLAIGWIFPLDMLWDLTMGQTEGHTRAMKCFPLWTQPA